MPGSWSAPGAVVTVTERTQAVSETSLSHVVTRADGTVMNLGVVSYWSKNPAKRLRWRLIGKPAADRRIRKFNAAQPKPEE